MNIDYSVKKMMGIIFIVAGIGLLAVGILVLTKNNDNKKENNANLENTNIITSKQKGDAFEEFVVNKFSKKYFNLLSWRSDKISKKHFPKDSLAPDLLFEFKLKDNTFLFAVECKYRSNYKNEGFEFEVKDLEKYRQFEATKEIPVFVIIGIGGTSDNPEKLYIVKLSEIKHNFLSKEFLARFEKKDINRNFFFDSEKIELR